MKLLDSFDHPPRGHRLLMEKRRRSFHLRDDPTHGVHQLVIAVSHHRRSATFGHPDRIGVGGGNHLRIRHGVNLLQFDQLLLHGQ
jgi:hypothetical protein